MDSSPPLSAADLGETGLDVLLRLFTVLVLEIFILCRKGVRLRDQLYGFTSTVRYRSKPYVDTSCDPYEYSPLNSCPHL